jgi:hypothetical protein
MRAFSGNEAVKIAFQNAVGKIATRRGSLDEFLARDWQFHPDSGVVTLTNSYLRDIDAQLSYETLGFPDKVILLILAMLGTLPVEDRQPWLSRLFQSIHVGADLAAMRVWERYVEWLLLHPLSGVVNDIDDGQRSARDAVKEVIRLLLTGSVEWAEWSGVNQELLRWNDRDLERRLLSMEFSEPMKIDDEIGDPEASAVFTAHLLVLCQIQPERLWSVDSVVRAANTTVPIRQQAAALQALMQGAIP